MLEQEKLKTLVPLASLEISATNFYTDIFKVNISKYVKRQKRLRLNLKPASKLVFGQYTDLSSMQLEVLTNWEAMESGSEVIKILKMVKSMSHHTTDQKYPSLFLYMDNKSVYGIHQGPLMTKIQLVDNLKARLEVVEDISGVVVAHTKLVWDKLSVYLREIVVRPKGLPGEIPCHGPTINDIP